METEGDAAAAREGALKRKLSLSTGKRAAAAGRDTAAPNVPAVMAAGLWAQVPPPLLPPSRRVKLPTLVGRPEPIAAAEEDRGAGGRSRTTAAGEGADVVDDRALGSSPDEQPTPAEAVSRPGSHHALPNEPQTPAEQQLCLPHPVALPGPQRNADGGCPEDAGDADLVVGGLATVTRVAQAQELAFAMPLLLASGAAQD
jgi:hypothetical protein